MTAWRSAWGLSLAFHLAVGLIATPMVGGNIPPDSSPLLVRLGSTSPAPAPQPTSIDRHLPSRPSVVDSRSHLRHDTVKTIEPVLAPVVPEPDVRGGPPVDVGKERSPSKTEGGADRLEEPSMAMAERPVDLSIVCPERPAPVYPAAARRRGEVGKVILAIRLDQKGTATVSLASSSGSRWLDEAAMQAVRLWRCNPAMQGGVTVQATALQTFSFVLQGGV